jgi:amino acid transporter
MLNRKISTFALVMTIFFCVSGGPYGLEPVMQSGALTGLLLILITPLIWALPSALLTAELSSAIPAEGGYYVWVKRAMGPMSGFFCAWLTYVYTWVDVAIYPVLFLGYLKTFGFAHFLKDPLYAFIATICFIIPLCWLNIRGVKTIGKVSVIFFVLLLIPFAIMVILGFTHAEMSGIFRMPATSEFSRNSMTAGLFVIMWNYLGWDSLSTISGEIKNSQKVFPRALLLTVPLVILVYFLPALIGISIQPDISQWTEGSWPAIAEKLGGIHLRYAMAIGGLFSAAGLFMVSLLASSRIPFVLAEDKLLPPFLTKMHPRYGTPWIAILVSAGIYAALSIFSFTQLAEIDVILYSSALLLEFIALVILRVKEPMLPRPYRIPGGWLVLGLVVLLPLSLIGFAFYMIFTGDSIATVSLMAAAIISGFMIWMARRKQ